MSTGPRERLLEAAVEILSEHGPEGTSLREIARRVGVSHGAPLRHFPSLSVLLSEVAADGFRQLAASCRDYADRAGHDPRERLRGSGRGYVAFALAQPGVFGLMWRSDLLDFDHPALAADAPAAFGVLTGLVAACQRAGWRPDADTRLVAASLWATAHGLAQLWLSGVIAPTAATASMEPLLTTAFDLVLPDPAPAAVPAMTER